MDHPKQIPFPFFVPKPASKEELANIVTRQHRGYELYLSGAVCRIAKDEWRVKSQKTAGKFYTVKRFLGRHVCNCPDFQERLLPCKHVFAVDYSEQNPVKPPRPAVAAEEKKRDWPLYNETKPSAPSRVAVMLGDLVHMLDNPPPQPGNQPLKPSELLFSAVMKSYVMESGRDFSGDVQRQWVNEGFLSRCYHFNTIAQFMRRPTTGWILRALIRETARPLHDILGPKALVIDSTGFATSCSSLWYDHKYGRTRKRTYNKLHIASDAMTHVVVDAWATDEDGADTAQLPLLLAGSLLAYDPDDVCADAIYTSAKNYRLVEDAGAMPFMPPRRGMTGKGSALMERLFHAFRSEDPEVLRRYHRRSQVESVAFMIKSQFGGAVKARSVVGRVNELFAIVLCHNLNTLVMVAAEYHLDVKLFDKNQAA